jgi:hypothetical protein
MLREALIEMGREDLIGNGSQHLIPGFAPPAAVKQVKVNKPFALPKQGGKKVKQGSRSRGR